MKGLLSLHGVTEGRRTDWAVVSASVAVRLPHLVSAVKLSHQDCCDPSGLTLLGNLVAALPRTCRSGTIWWLGS